MAALVCAIFAHPGVVWCDPVEVSSPELRRVKVEADRPTGRLIIYANYSSHRVIVDGAEFPAYLSDSGIEVTSNEIHEVTVVNSGGVETEIPAIILKFQK